METKLLLFIETEADFSLLDNYDGAYTNLNLIPTNIGNKELFISAIDFTAPECYALSLKAPKNSVFVCDDVTKAAFIKSACPTAKISFYSDVYNEKLIPFISANGFDVTLKYTALAPERIAAFKNANAKVNGATVKRLDEVGVLKYWQVDYVTVTKNAK